jgi:alanine racemase
VAAAVEEYDLMPTILDLDAAEIFSSRCRRVRNGFVKVDLGLERLGVAPEDVVDFVTSLAAFPRLRVYGVYAHLHVPDHGGVTPYLRWQYGRFESALERLRGAGLEIPVTMTASTSVLNASTTTMNLNAIDPGLVFFGLDQQGAGLRGAGLRPAFHALTSRLIQVKTITRTEFLDMAPFPMSGPMRVGIIPIGRCDGMGRVCCGQVLVGGQRVNVLGGVTTEHTRVDLTRVSDARVGDAVVIIGRQGREEITPDEVAEHQGLWSGGMVALEVRDSVPRVYLGGPQDGARASQA